MKEKHIQKGSGAVKCLRCGAELKNGAAFCTECGYRIPERQKTAGSSPKVDGTYRYVPDRGTSARPAQSRPVQNNPAQSRPVRPVQNQPVKKKKGPSLLTKLGNAVRAFLKWCFKLMIISLVAALLTLLVKELTDRPPKIADKKENTKATQSTTVATIESTPSIQTDYVFYSIQEMKNTLAPVCIEEELDVTVHYKGNQEDIWKFSYGQLLGGRSGGIRTLEPEVYRIVASPYAGSKMLRAYRTGDVSNLTEDERQALNVAESVVAAARKEAGNDMELELWLHDWMCRNISYYDVDFDIEFSDRRQLNAVGALLDGKANCQGYTDCFYLLGNMAGFTVDRQVMPEHIFNTIKLGGNWYIVDVTHNDSDNIQHGQEMISYRYFNVGMDYTDGRSWDPEASRNIISQVSGSYYYYHLTDQNGYNKLFDSIDILADHILYANTLGKKTAHGMLLGAELTHEELFDAMHRVAKKKNIRFGSVYAMYNNATGNTIYSVVFE